MENLALSLALDYKNPFDAVAYMSDPIGRHWVIPPFKKGDLLIHISQIERLNLCIQYRYRDSGNYKTETIDMVWNGALTWRQIQMLRESLETNDLFLPGQVGLRDAFELFEEEGHSSGSDDHVWNEVEDIFLTVAPATEQQSARSILGQFLRVAEDGGWDVTSAMRARGLI